MPREHPIPFSAPMVRALLADRKSVTRRLSKQWLKAKAGDRLWVRENWRTTAELDHLSPRQIGRASVAAGWDSPWCPTIFSADNHRNNWDDEINCNSHSPGRLRVGMHLPRWASRILLECEEDARVERLQDITEEECLLEGFLPEPGPTDEDISEMDEFDATFARALGDGMFTAKFAFLDLWSSLHTHGGRWEDNPEVVRVGRFRRVYAAKV